MSLTPSVFNLYNKACVHRLLCLWAATFSTREGFFLQLLHKKRKATESRGKSEKQISFVLSCPPVFHLSALRGFLATPRGGQTIGWEPPPHNKATYQVNREKLCFNTPPCFKGRLWSV